MIPNAKAFNLQHQRLWLMPEKAVYWQKRKTLLVTDIHIGKSGHFRKNGIAVPGQVNRTNLERLSRLISETKPEHLIILGDLFHSDINSEWQQFVEWRKTHQQLETSLVVGNHDILQTKNYHKSVINIFGKLRIDPFLMVHDIHEQENSNEDSYILSGHIHPAVKLKGKGRQSMKLPCFFFGNSYGVLPAFGTFTGTHVINPRKKDRVFIIADNKILSAGNLRREK